MSTPFSWIDQEAALAPLLQRWQTLPALYVDTEFMRERTYDAVLALVQVNDGQDNALLDPTRLRPEQLMPALLGRKLVMHACSEDLLALKVWGGEAPRQVEDTQIAAALCGHDLQCGYQKLVRELLGEDIPKDATRTDWLKRPLSRSQLDYAALDVAHLPALHQRLTEELEKLGRLAWWHEECERLVSDALAVTPPEDLWRSVKGAGAVVDDAARLRLQALAAWRDGCARARDLPRSFVLKDTELLSLCQASPLDSRTLSGLGLHPSAVRRYGEQLLDLVNGVSGPAPEPLPGPPDAATRRAVKRLREVLNRLSAELGLSTEVLARRRWLEALVAHPTRPVAAFLGWRRELVLKPLLESLDD